MDIKAMLMFVALCLTDIARAQTGDFGALLSSFGADLGAGGSSGGGGAGCPLREFPNNRQKFLQGGAVKDCPANTMFDRVVCACIFIPKASNTRGNSLGLSNLFPGGDAGGGMSNPLLGLSGAGGLANMLSGGGLAGMLGETSSGGGGGLSDLLSGGAAGASAGGLADLLSGGEPGSSSGGLNALLFGGARGSSAGGLGALLSGGEQGSSSGGLSALLSGGNSGSSFGGLNELLFGSAGGSSARGLGNLLSGSAEGPSAGGLSDLLSGSVGGSSAGRLSDLSGGARGSSSRGLNGLLSGSSSRRGAMTESLSRSSSGSSSGGGLKPMLSAGGGGLDALLSTGSLSGTGSTLGGGLGDNRSGGKPSAGTGDMPALDALLNQLTSKQGGTGSPIRPAPTAPPQPEPVKPRRNPGRSRNALKRILDRTSGSKPSSLMGQSNPRRTSSRPSPPPISNVPDVPPRGLNDLLGNRNRKRPLPRQSAVMPKPAPTRKSQPRRRPTSQAQARIRPTQLPSWGQSSSQPRRRRPSSGQSLPPPTSIPVNPPRNHFDQLLSQLGAANPTAAGPRGRRRNGGGGGGLADLQRSLSGGSPPGGQQQSTSEMAQLLAALGGPGLGESGGFPLGGAGILNGGGGAVESLLAGLSGGLGPGGIGVSGRKGALGGASAMMMGTPQVPDLTSILNRRGAMMPLGARALSALKTINPIQLAALERSGAVDVSDLTMEGRFALASLIGQ